MTGGRITIGQIMEAVGATTGFRRVEMAADRRQPDLIRARYTCFWLARELTQLSLNDIGAQCGGQAISTVQRGCEAVERWRAAEPEFLVATDALAGTLTALARSGLLRLGETAEPLAIARRVLANPEREAVRVGILEIIAMAQLIVELLGGDDEPTPSPLSSMEAPDGQIDAEDEDRRREPAGAAVAR